MTSCNSGRIAELEADNQELRTRVEQLTVEVQEAQRAADEAMAIARMAEQRAIEQARKAQEQKN